MNSRERFLAAMSFQPVDQVPLPCLFQQFEAETIRRWQREGLPRDVHAEQHFGFERMELVPVNLGLLPGATWPTPSRPRSGESAPTAATPGMR